MAGKLENVMFPITPTDLQAMKTRALRLSYDWLHWGRYSVWIQNVPNFGWSVMTDYGRAGDECVVTSPRTREACIEELKTYIRQHGDPRHGYNLTIDEWE